MTVAVAAVVSVGRSDPQVVEPVTDEILDRMSQTDVNITQIAIIIGLVVGIRVTRQGRQPAINHATIV